MSVGVSPWASVTVFLAYLFGLLILILENLSTVLYFLSRYNLGSGRARTECMMHFSVG